MWASEGGRAVRVKLKIFNFSGYYIFTSTNFIPIALKFVLVEIVLVETVLVGDPL